MTKPRAHQIYLGKNDEGRYIAASASSPYFCFEAETEGEARETARRALNFYFGKVGDILPAPIQKAPTQTRLSRVFRSKTETIEINSAVA